MSFILFSLPFRRLRIVSSTAWSFFVVVASPRFSTSSRSNCVAAKALIERRNIQNIIKGKFPPPDGTHLVYEFNQIIALRVCSLMPLIIGIAMIPTLLKVEIPDDLSRLANEKSLAGLAGTVLLIGMYLVSRRIVVASFRRDDKYITLMNAWFGFGARAIHHGPKDCVYYPSRGLLAHELFDKRVMMFPECFKNVAEENEMCRIIH